MQFGTLSVLVGLLFSAMFLPLRDFDMACAIGPFEHATGVVVRTTRESAQEGDVYVYEIGYRFRTPDGTDRDGIAYVTGDATREGASVDVTYSVGRPSRSRVEGMRRSTFGLSATFVLLFPILGVLSVLRGFAKGRRAATLLALGEVATARFTSSTLESTDEGVETWRMTYRFETPLGLPYTAERKTTSTAQRARENDEEVIYAVENPSIVEILSDLPDQPRIDASGKIFPAEAGPLGAYFILPTLAAAALVAVCIYGVMGFVSP